MSQNQNSDCIFCWIIAGDIPAETVYEDDHFLAFLDINPQAPGHIQLIPKQHYRWVWDLPTEAQADSDQPTIEQYFKVAKHLAEAQRRAFNTDWIISRVVGDEVPHAHVWLFPGDAEGDKQDLKGNAEKIKSALSKNA